MDKHEDLRLSYIAANKEPVTIELLEELLLRAYASHFCGEDDGADITGTIIAQLAGAICTLRLAIAYDEDDSSQEDAVEQQILRGPDAEAFYCKKVAEFYTAHGYDDTYANEAAQWPDLLAMDAEYSTDILTKMAKIEVGHDLLVIDYLRATANQKKKT
jgi:hypothetical protein